MHHVWEWSEAPEKGWKCKNCQALCPRESKDGEHSSKPPAHLFIPVLDGEINWRDFDALLPCEELMVTLVMRR